MQTFTSLYRPSCWEIMEEVLYKDKMMMQFSHSAGWTDLTSMDAPGLH